MITLLKPEEQHQHKNGGGWVANTVTIDDSVYVAPNAQVYGNAQVCGNAIVSGDARVYGNACVYGNAQVFGDAQVYDNARVYGNALVSGNAQVYGDAQVYGNALVYGEARVFGDAWALSPLYIQGSRHAVSLASYSKIAIGRHIRPIQYWKDNYKEIGEQERYSTQQIKEYLSYILLCEQYVARYVKNQAMSHKRGR